MDGLPRSDAILRMKGMVTMADDHFRVNVERLGVDLKNVTARIHWDRGAGVECRFEFEAHASEETPSMALDDASMVDRSGAYRCHVK
jgi:hypothetical protein